MTPSHGRWGGPSQGWLPRPYQQMLRGPAHRWWRPIIGLVVVLGSVAILLVTGAVVWAVLAVLGVVPAATAAGAAGEVTPLWLAAMNLLLAMLIPIAQLAVWVGHGRRPRWVASVLGGIRRRWLLQCYGIAALVFVPITVALVPLDGGFQLAPENNAVWLLLVVFVTTPLQAAGEEYLFRGWIPLAIGSLIPRAAAGAVIGAGISCTLFAYAHGQQDPWLFADRFLFGAVASWLVWRTGGLEAGIAVHGTNNLVALTLTILQGQLSATLNATQADPLSLVVDVSTLAVVALLIDRRARRRGVVRLFRPPIATAAPTLPAG